MKKTVAKKVLASALATMLLLPLTALCLSVKPQAAGETWVKEGEDQYPSHKIYGAYWHDAVKTETDKSKSWGKTRVVQDRTLPPRAFFIPTSDATQALNTPLKKWRELNQWQSLSGTEWKFKLVKKPDEVITNFHEAAFDASAWGTMPVPANWQFYDNGIGDEPMYSNWYYPWGQKSWTLFGKPNIPGETVNYSFAYLMTAPKNYNPVGHYIRDFEVPATRSGQQVILNFQGVQSAFYVYVNGKYVGYSEDSFTQHEFDITNFVKYGAANRLAVLVYRWSDGSLLENQDMVNYSGITRDVGLIYRDASAYLQDFSNRVTLSNNYTQATLETALKLPAGAQARVKLYDQGSLIATSAWVQNEGKAQITVDSAKLWSTENPYLYKQIIEVAAADGTVKEYVPYEIGLREVGKMEVDNGKHTYAINGHRIVFKGVNRHELDSNRGHVVAPETLETDLKLMRQHNVNAIRTCHYPNQVDLYILCNEYGLMICDEANLETHAAGGTNGIPMAVETFRYPALHRGMNMYERDKNFSCVVTWSTGNECIFWLPPAVDDNYSFRLMYKYIKERDNQRPIVLERDPREGITDIRSRMYWAASEHDNFNFMEPIESNDKKILDAEDKRPYFQVEYAHSMGNSLGYYKEYWDLWRQYKHAMGGFIWDWVDQSPLWPIPSGQAVRGMSFTADGKKLPAGGTHYYAYGGDWAMDKNNNFNNFMDNGLISPDRIPHDSHQQLKYVQQDILFSNLDLANLKVDIKNEFAFTNLDNYDFEAEITKNGKSVGVKRFAVNVAPETTSTVTLPDLSDLLPADVTKAVDAQYHLTLNARLRNDVSIWGKAGDSIAFEQFALNKVDKTSYKVPVETGWKNTVQEDNDNVVVYSPRFKFVFNKKLGQWTSYQVDGEEYFAQSTDPGFVAYQTTDKRLMTPGMYANFWRAPVDNDRENGWLDRVKHWREANWWKNSVKVTIDKPREDVTTIDVINYYTNRSEVHEIYQIYSDGHVRYYQELDPTRGSEIPSVGAVFELKGKFKQLQYYGRGPATTFVDRWEGYPVGIYKENVDVEQLGNYVKPQENANHVNVYWAKIQDEQGRGLFFKSTQNNEQLEVMASPYNQYDVTDHMHPYELTTTDRTFMRVAFKNQGVGGENSWGARPLPYAEIKPEKQMHEFDIFPITPSAAGNSVSSRAAEPKPAYPQHDDDALYRTVREESNFIKSVAIKRNGTAEAEAYPEFSEAVYEYLIPYVDGQDPATANVVIEMVHPEAFAVKTYHDPEHPETVIAEIRRVKEADGEPLVTYKFTFEAANVTTTTETTTVETTAHETTVATTTAAETTASESVAPGTDNNETTATTTLSETSATTSAAATQPAITTTATPTTTQAEVTTTTSARPTQTSATTKPTTAPTVTTTSTSVPDAGEPVPSKTPKPGFNPDEDPSYMKVVKDVILTGEDNGKMSLVENKTFDINKFEYQDLDGKNVEIVLYDSEHYSVEYTDSKAEDGKLLKRIAKIYALTEEGKIEWQTYTFNFKAASSASSVATETIPTTTGGTATGGSSPDSGSKFTQVSESKPQVVTILIPDRLQSDMTIKVGNANIKPIVKTGEVAHVMGGTALLFLTLLVATVSRRRRR